MATSGGAKLSESSFSTSEPSRVPTAVGTKLMGKKQLEAGANVADDDEPDVTSGQADRPLPASAKFAETLGLLPVAGMGKVSSVLPMFRSSTI